MGLGRSGWLVAVAASVALGAACNGEIDQVPNGNTDGGVSSGNEPGASSGYGASSGAEPGTSSGNGASSGAGPDGGPITGPRTTLSGVVYLPNGVTPLGQATVSWSRTAPAALPTGPFCNACTTPEAGTFALSAADGSFTLDVPVDEDVFITTQMGNFRRVRSHRFSQTDTQLPIATSTLPGRNELQGDTVPSIGALPGAYDNIASVLDQLGVKNVVSLTENDLSNPVELQRYQIVLMPSSGGCNKPRAQEPSVQATLRQFVSAGGALYISDDNYQYFHKAFAGFVGFPDDACAGDNKDASIRFDDVALATYVAAPPTNQLGDLYVRTTGTFTLPGPGRNGANTALTPKVWATATSLDPNQPVMVSVPYGCGTAMYSSLLAGDLFGGAPSAEGQLRGRALSYMLFRAHDGCSESPPPACTGTPSAQCTPGQAPGAPVSCGYCGTAQQRCSDQCRLIDSSCENEVVDANRCLPGSTRVSNEGCPANEVRVQACRPANDPNRCSWAPPSGACVAPVLPTLDVPALNATNSRPISAAEQASMRVPGHGNACPVNSVGERIGTIVEIRNTSASAARLVVTVTPDDDIDRELSLYSALPSSDAALKACTSRNDDCASMVGVESCVSGVTVPANGKLWALVNNYTTTAPSTPFTLSVERVP